MLYDEISKIRGIEEKPRFEYLGELIHYVLVKQSETIFLETKRRYIVTSLEKRKDISIIHIYYNGKRITGKRVSNERPMHNESASLIDWLIMKIKMGEIK